jgi:hypothetical protein
MPTERQSPHVHSYMETKTIISHKERVKQYSTEMGKGSGLRR